MNAVVDVLLPTEFAMSPAGAASRAERSGDQVPRSGDLRSELRWDIAAMAPIRTISM